MFARVPTTPYADQKPGTSGLRKRVTVFEQPNYTANFVQATFNALRALHLLPHTLLIGGDGRYYSSTAVQLIVRLACANGVRRVWVAQHGLMSTPAVSTVMRRRAGGFAAQGAFILTASHNPGGPHADFGIKYNSDNGGPASEKLTAAMYKETLAVRTLHMCTTLPEIDVHTCGVCYTGEGIDDAARAAAADTSAAGAAAGADAAVTHPFTVEVIDALEDYVQYMQEIFDFAVLRRFLALPGVRVYMDSMHGASGPYVRAIFHDCLHVPLDALHRTTPRDDFGGAHPDPNLTYAHELVQAMGLLPSGLVNADMLPPRAAPAAAGKATTASNGVDMHDDNDVVPFFGAAFDGDADRNMILGRRCFVNPSDSVAVLAAHAHVVPYFCDKQQQQQQQQQTKSNSVDNNTRRSTLRTVARSMPTSRALDRVAADGGLTLFEVPTGWKFFGNLMDSHAVYGGADYTPLICGEESFGTGSCHIREKDGIWAALFWLSILADANGCNNNSNSNSNSTTAVTAHAPLVGVQQVMEAHWSHHGRCYALRYDYEDVATEAAAAVLRRVRALAATAVPPLRAAHCVGVDDFCYTDPVDHSVAAGQGVRVQYDDGSRFVLRLSGTGSTGATIRLYLEQYMEAAAVRAHMAQHTLPSPSTALHDLVHVALQVSGMQELTGRDAPTVIT